MSTNIHPTAVVDAAAKIHESVVIGPNALVEGNVEIGKNSRIDGNVKIGYGARIGEACRIYHGAVISEEPQDLKFHGEESITKIGDRTMVREYATIHRGTEASGITQVGSDCLLMAYTHVAHDCIVGDHAVLANVVTLGGHVKLDDWVYIGGMTGVHQFTHIGKHAFIGGGFRCVQDVPPYVLVAGEPLKYTGLNVVGLRRRGFSNQTIEMLKEAYRLIYRSEFNISQALEQLQSGFEPSEEIKEVIDFIRHSERGIVY